MQNVLKKHVNTTQAPRGQKALNGAF